MAFNNHGPNITQQTLLHIDSSPRLKDSYSRTFSGKFVEAWKARHLESTVVYRDLVHDPIPHVDAAWVEAALLDVKERSAAHHQALAVSDHLVDEFLATDRLVIGLPMHNLHVPSTFKAYIDQIVRAGRTFMEVPGGFEGLVHGKKMIVISSRGGFFHGESPFARFDFQEPWLRSILGVLGLTQITFLRLEGLNSTEEARTAALQQAHAEIDKLVTTW